MLDDFPMLMDLLTLLYTTDKKRGHWQSRNLAKKDQGPDGNKGQVTLNTL